MGVIGKVGIGKAQHQTEEIGQAQDAEAQYSVETCLGDGRPRRCHECGEEVSSFSVRPTSGLASMMLSVTLVPDGSRHLSRWEAGSPET